MRAYGSPLPPRQDRRSALLRVQVPRVACRYGVANDSVASKTDSTCRPGDIRGGTDCEGTQKAFNNQPLNCGEMVGVDRPRRSRCGRPGSDGADAAAIGGLRRRGLRAGADLGRCLGAAGGTCAGRDAVGLGALVVSNRSSSQGCTMSESFRDSHGEVRPRLA
jgi:hypothetical protein